MNHFTLLSCLLFSFGANAATYYVATNGSNAAAGTIGAPWATLRYGASTMSEGDTLLLRGGEHHDDGFQLSEFKSNTRFENYPGEFPTYRNITYAGNMIRVNGRTNMVFSGIDFFGDIETAAIFKIDGGAQNITLTNCTIRGAHDGHGLLISPMEAETENGNLVITHCRFITNGWAALITDSDLHQIYMQNSSNIIEHCYVEGITNVKGGGFGIHFYTSGANNCIFRNNYFTNCPSGSIGLVGSFSRDIQVYNNVSVGSGYGLDVRNSSNIVVLNNTFVSNSVGIKSEYSTNIVIENNITIGTADGIFLYPDNDGVVVRNNLSYGNANSDLRVASSFNITTNANLFKIEAIGLTPVWTTNAANYDVKFVHAARANYALKIGSSAEKAGRTQTVFSTDHLGRQRMIPWDIGAYFLKTTIETLTTTTLNIGQ